MSKPDLVTELRESGDEEVLGFDGFWAAKRDGVWGRFSSIVGHTDRICVSDPIRADALSKAARAAMSG